MDINTKLNVTFLIFSLLSILFVKVASKNGYDPSHNVRAFIGLIAGIIIAALLIAVPVGKHFNLQHGYDKNTEKCFRNEMYF